MSCLIKVGMLYKYYCVCCIEYMAVPLSFYIFQSTSNNRVNRPPSISGSTSSGSDQYASAHSDEDDDYEVDMDSLTSDTPRAAPVMVPMIPPDCTNPLEALNSFTHQFANRCCSVSLMHHC